MGIVLRAQSRSVLQARTGPDRRARRSGAAIRERAEDAAKALGGAGRHKEGGGGRPIKKARRRGRSSGSRGDDAESRGGQQSVWEGDRDDRVTLWYSSGINFIWWDPLQSLWHDRVGGGLG